MELDLYVALHYSTGKFYNALEQYVYLRLRPVRSIRTRAGDFPAERPATRAGDRGRGRLRPAVQAFAGGYRPRHGAGGASQAEPRRAPGAPADARSASFETHLGQDGWRVAQQCRRIARPVDARLSDKRLQHDKP